MPTIRIGSGSTKPGNTQWTQYNPPAGITVIVDTSAAKFTTTPVYVVSLGGKGSHWRTTGGSSVYAASPTSFVIYVRWAEPTAGMPALTPALANSAPYEWHILWHGIEP